jgi:hypothetical protein
MKNYICVTCGTQFSASEDTPDHCPICVDERQFVGWEGQQWTTLDELCGKHHNRIEPEGDELLGISSEPSFAIGQRALYVQTPDGNLLWDCVSVIDEQTIERINSLGGIRAIAISHPHFYATMNEWSEAFGGVPIYLHTADREWVMHDSPKIHFWEGTTHTLWEGLTLINCGGHFEGGTILHWANGTDGRGALLTGDVINVVYDRRYVSFMRSYPNLIPLSAATVRQIVERVEPFAFERIYGAWWERYVMADGKAAFMRSAERYLNALDDRRSA